MLIRALKKWDKEFRKGRAPAGRSGLWNIKYRERTGIDDKYFKRAKDKAGNFQLLDGFDIKISQDYNHGQHQIFPEGGYHLMNCR